MFKDLGKSITKSLVIWIFIWVWILIAYAADITSISQTVTSWDKIKANWFNDVASNITTLSWKTQNIYNNWTNVGIWTSTPWATLDVNWQIVWWFWAQTTWWVTDWNDVTNSRSWNWYTLLQWSSTNWPAVAGANYFHPINFEYSNKNWAGNITQLAIPYWNAASLNQSLYLRGRYSWTWSSWSKIISENTSWNVWIWTNSPQSYWKLEINTTWGKSIYTMDTANWWLLIWYSWPNIQGRTTAHWNDILILNQYGGNVWVWKATPTQKLDVVGNIQSTGNHIINNTAPTIYLQDSDNRSAMIHNNSNLFYILRWDGTNSTVYAPFGWYWPLYLNLENNDAQFWWVVRAPGWFVTSSDIRLKKNIEKIENPIEKIQKLNWYNFDWKESWKHGVWVIAQEVEKVFPELVSESINARWETYKAVDYWSLVAPLLEAIKEQQKEIDKLKDRIKTLENN